MVPDAKNRAETRTKARLVVDCICRFPLKAV
jgi:hypothetical protein